MNMPSLLTLTQTVADKNGLHIDRTVRRTKDGLICWFCECAWNGTTSKETSETGKPQESSGNGFEFQELQNADWFSTD
jgi:hypothetical protein